MTRSLLKFLLIDNRQVSSSLKQIKLYDKEFFYRLAALFMGVQEEGKNFFVELPIEKFLSHLL
jgi:hypothetical protein